MTNAPVGKWMVPENARSRAVRSKPVRKQRTALKTVDARKVEEWHRTRVDEDPKETNAADASRSPQPGATDGSQSGPLSDRNTTQPVQRYAIDACGFVEPKAVACQQASVPAQSAKHGLDVNRQSGPQVGLTVDDLAELNEELGRMTRLRAEAVKAAASMRLLIAGAPSADRPHEVPFLTPELYETRNGRWPSAGELDEASVLIKDDQGNYLSKTAFYCGIKINPQLSKAAQLNARDRKFAQEMEALGLSAIHFGASRPATNAERIYQTPAGERERERVFEHPVQAGAAMPDMMVRDGHGKCIGIYPKLDSEAKGNSLKGVTERFGAGNVWLKTAENSYETVEVMNERAPNSAEQAFAGFKRDPVPAVLISKSNGAFVSKARHDEVLKGSIQAARADPERADQGLCPASGASSENSNQSNESK